MERGLQNSVKLVVREVGGGGGGLLPKKRRRLSMVYEGRGFEAVHILP